MKFYTIHQVYLYFNVLKYKKKYLRFYLFEAQKIDLLQYLFTCYTINTQIKVLNLLYWYIITIIPIYNTV